MYNDIGDASFDDTVDVDVEFPTKVSDGLLILEDNYDNVVDGTVGSLGASLGSDIDDNDRDGTAVDGTNLPITLKKQ